MRYTQNYLNTILVNRNYHKCLYYVDRLFDVFYDGGLFMSSQGSIQVPSERDTSKCDPGCYLRSSFSSSCFHIFIFLFSSFSDAVVFDRSFTSCLTRSSGDQHVSKDNTALTSVESADEEVFPSSLFTTLYLTLLSI